jgi:hypothetical protein
MKQIATSILSFLIITLSLSSCKKDNELSKSELLTKQPWKMTVFIEKNLSTGTEQDKFGPMSACYKDDDFVYKPDMSFEANAGTTKCDPADPEVFQTGSWRFKDNETILETVITSGLSTGSTFEYDVISITATELRLHTVQSGSDYQFTFSH